MNRTALKTNFEITETKSVKKTKQTNKQSVV